MLSAYQIGPEESSRWINSKHFHISLYSSKVSLLPIMLTFQFSRWSGCFLSLGQIEMWWLRQDDWPLSKKHKVHLFIGLPLRATPNHEMRSSILSMSKKDKMANGFFQKALLVLSHSHFNAGRGWVVSGRLVNRFGSRFGTNTKLLRGLLALYLRPADGP